MTAAAVLTAARRAPRRAQRGTQLHDPRRVPFMLPTAHAAKLHQLRLLVRQLLPQPLTFLPLPLGAFALPPSLAAPSGRVRRRPGAPCRQQRRRARRLAHLPPRACRHLRRARLRRRRRRLRCAHAPALEQQRLLARRQPLREAVRLLVLLEKKPNNQTSKW